MGQKEVLDALTNKGWVTKAELLEICNCGSSSITQSLIRLCRGGFIVTKKYECRKHAYLYKIKEEGDEVNETDCG